MGLRHRSVRLRIGVLVVVPILCVIGIYGFAASVTLGGALAQAHATTIRDQLLLPVTAFQAQLDKERIAALLSLASPMETGPVAELGIQEGNTVKAETALLAALHSPQVTDNASAGEQRAIASLVKAAGTLSYIRGNVNADAITIVGAMSDYDSIIDTGYAVLRQALDGESNVPVVTQALDVINLDRALEISTEESALLSADLAQGKFPSTDRTTFAQLAAVRSDLYSTTVPDLLPAYRALLDKHVSTQLSNSVTAVEGQVIKLVVRRGEPPDQLTGGVAAFARYQTALAGALSQAGVQLEAQARDNANSVFLRLLLAAALGLLGTIASVVLSFVVGRGLVRQLRELRRSALVLANERLPEVASRLRAGEPVDMTEYQVVQVPSKSEIEQVSQALTAVQRTAVQAAVDEAKLRRGIGEVFRNLAGRSQSLLHRQLTLIDGMERRATEPDELEALFRIDHLTTRMRRQAEGLIILSGETPTRGWRRPVPIIDVLRAAVAEVEDYTRIRVFSRTGAAVAGHAVADVIHLIAELAENATVFSPPNTPVRIQADVVGRGLAVEIEDRGLGISAERLNELNTNLASPPQFDLAGSDRLGLLIAGQLAHRHGIQISLSPSVYGGITAIALIPASLVVEEEAYRHEAPPLADPIRGGLTGRHAALPASADRASDILDADLAALTSASRTGTDYDGDYASNRGSLPPGNGRVTSFAETDHGAAATTSPSPSGTAPETSGWSLGGQREAIPLRPVDAEDPDVQVSTAELAELGLPVRIRQANLAPQLRNSEQSAGSGSGFAFGDQAVGATTGGENVADGAADIENSTGAASVWSLGAPANASGSPDPASIDAFSAGPDARSSAETRSAETSNTDVFAAASNGHPSGTYDTAVASSTGGIDSVTSPEAARNTMSALQRGWQLGRSEAGLASSDSGAHRVPDPGYGPDSGAHRVPDTGYGPDSGATGPHSDSLDAEADHPATSDPDGSAGQHDGE
ncbi:MAG TPA: nitrate- and nitrite sensing domain-containing protein [Streptosporangiaceae bacterium]